MSSFLDTDFKITLVFMFRRQIENASLYLKNSVVKKTVVLEVKRVKMKGYLMKCH